MHQKTYIASLIALACLTANASNYYVVVPFHGKTMNLSSIEVELLTAALPAATVGLAYSYNFMQNLQVTGDSTYTGPGVAWAVIAGSLPVGLDLDPRTGVLGGVPSAPGPANFTIQATYKTKNGTKPYQLVALYHAALRAPDALTFPTTTVAMQSAAKIVTLTNTGTAPLPVTAPAITGPFTVSATTCADSLAVSASCTYSVKFLPDSVGTFTGALTGTTAAGAWSVTLGGDSSPAVGQVAFTTPGTYAWTAPAGVAQVSAVAVGGGGSSGGGGGGLGWKNNISVTPGSSYTVVVGGVGGTSYFVNSSTVHGGGGSLTAGGTFVGDGGGVGGADTNSSTSKGGGGAGGYTGSGGAGAYTGSGKPGSGGGGGGGAWGVYGGGGGGGGGLYGQGARGAGGTGSSGGSGGSGGLAGASANSTSVGGIGGLYGGGGGYMRSGGTGAVRIIWGPNRAFPATNTADR